MPDSKLGIIYLSAHSVLTRIPWEGEGDVRSSILQKGENLAGGGLGWVSGYTRSHNYKAIEPGFEPKSIRCQSHGLFPTLASLGRGQMGDTSGGSR